MTLAQIMKQDDIYIESAELELRNTLNLMNIEAYKTGTFFESGGGVTKERLLTKIKKFFEKLIQKVKDFFTSKVIKKKTEDIENALQKNPELKNQKVKIKDTRKLEELDKKTLQQLKTAKNTKNLMDSYRKRRKALLASLGVITITIGVAFGVYKKLGKKSVEDLQETEKKVISQFQNKNLYLQPSKKITGGIAKRKDGEDWIRVDSVTATEPTLQIDEIVAASTEIAKNQQDTILMKNKIYVEAFGNVRKPNRTLSQADRKLINRYRTVNNDHSSSNSEILRRIKSDKHSLLWSIDHKYDQTIYNRAKGRGSVRRKILPPIEN